MSANDENLASLTEQQAHAEVGYVRMRDGTRLAYIVWRPQKRGRYPTILAYGPYHQAGSASAAIQYFLESGYAYIGVNVRGTGASEGLYSYYQPIEAADGVEVIEWAAAQSWSTGDIAMVGGSYLGHTQIKVAALRPPHLRAIVPVSTEGSEYRDEGRTGGLFNAGLMATWTFDIQPALARTGNEARMRLGDTECASIAARQSPNPSYDEVLQHPTYDDWWRVRALDTMVEQITVPTLLIHAWQDEWIRANGALRLFKLLKCPHKRLILQNGPHRLGAYQITKDEELKWLDRWVKGERNGAESAPAVAVYWEVTESREDSTVATPNWITTYPSWPAPGLEWIPFFLSAAGELQLERPVDEGARSYRYPLGTELVGSDEQFALAPHPLGGLSYRTQPLEADMAVLGAPRLTLYFSSEQTDTDFLFTLKDVDPAGNTLFLQRSVLRASMRAVDEQLSSPDELIQSFAQAQTLVPGRVTELRVSLSALGHVVRKGHRLELSILAPGPTPNPVWGFVPISAPGLNSIYHGQAHLSQLCLPVVPGEKARKPAPKLGALRNQPYRPARRQT